MPAPGWLTERPVAHRGLHDRARGIVENTASAVEAAIAGGFAIEVDVQEAADGTPVVFHDDTLERLTHASGPVAALDPSELKAAVFRETADRIQTLDELLEQVDDRAPLVIEIKTDFTGKAAYSARVAERVARYRGRAALMSFDPGAVTAVRLAAPAVLRGITAEGYRTWKPRNTSRGGRAAMRYLAHAVRSRPHFVAYSVDDLPALAPTVMRRLFGIPLLTWTVRTEEQRMRAAEHADQMIFEGFVP
ncbi:glycerophosphodiester phosphodiesterase family protein [Lutibaculum baratangense]|uniref:Glycerophosphoryl diester phosphodiesterase n=1 Tax=Lutibaculum baratangense AMV1 TaxID=631454 RepID=V4RDX3_9HYPH|nr:glycerophosphodiester phosphodiesterase family protein [Lutibaculum baratangense]ESR23584.1 Glycerophosphoryl diester phosphodiesterase [Lutibaculum baratangense AMV1]